MKHAVDVVADVRSAPYSRYSPQFNRDELAACLDEKSIRYEFLGGSLGGRPDDPECYDEKSHVLYNELEKTSAYREGIDELEWLVRERRNVCLMCSEEDPAVCHRALSIGHFLTARRTDVLHIRRDGSVQRQDEVIKPLQVSMFEEEPLRKSLRPVLRERAPSSSSRS
jgi:uncharacterized protein (DUF488 family)